MDRIESITLDCGATLLVEENPAMRSVGLSWLLPMGSAYDPADRVGTAAVLSDWMWRGAGDLNTKDLSDAFDRLGVQRDSSVETHHLRLGAVMIGDQLAEALPLLVSMVRRPRLGDETFEPVRDLCQQSIAGLLDEPQSRSMLLLKEKHFPAPFNRSTLGSEEGIAALSPDEARAHWRAHAVPRGSIIGISGNVRAEAVARQLNDLFADWTGAIDEPSTSDEPQGRYTHESDESAQCHIGIAFHAPPEPDERSMLQRVATAVLSGGMSGRLFTEVREKRSLCYSVYASYAAGRDRGAVMGYSGTTPDRAQETLDVMTGEFKRLREGIDASEFQRAAVGMKSRLVMQGESTSARASSIARDQYLVGRPRTLRELAERVDAVGMDDVNDYLAQRAIDAFTIVTLGPAPLAPPD